MSKRTVVTVVVAVLATTAVVAVSWLGRDGRADQSASSSSTSTPSTTAAPDITTSTWLPSQTYVGGIHLTLATDVPGNHTVTLRWGTNGRDFAAVGGTSTTYCFDKKAPVGPSITLSATVEIRSTLDEGCPAGGIDVNGKDWYSVTPGGTGTSSPS